MVSDGECVDSAESASFLISANQLTGHSQLTFDIQSVSSEDEEPQTGDTVNVSAVVSGACKFNSIVSLLIFIWNYNNY